jgi:hypothetical protein
VLRGDAEHIDAFFFKGTLNARRKKFDEAIACFE